MIREDLIKLMRSLELSSGTCKIRESKKVLSCTHGVNMEIAVRFLGYHTVLTESTSCHPGRRSWPDLSAGDSAHQWHYRPRLSSKAIAIRCGGDAKHTS